MFLNNLILPDRNPMEVYVRTNPYRCSVFKVQLEIALCVLALLLPLGIQGQPCVPAPAGLVSWWRAEGNTDDANGTNLGALVGNTAYGAGRLGQSFVFDGHGDAVPLGNPVSLRLQDFTIEAWIKRASASVSSLDIYGSAAFLEYGYGGYGFGMLDNGKLFLTKVGIDNVTLSTGITDTNWHHVAVSKVGSTVVFYIDGVAFPILSVYNTSYDFSSSVSIGARGGDQAASFLGAIDELAVYNRALSTNEIQAIYNASSAGKCQTSSCVPAPSGLVSWWQAESNASDVVDGNHGLLQGGLTFGAGEGGQAFSFDGANGYLQVAASSNLNVGAGNGFTVDCWIKPGDVGNLRPLIEWNDSLGNIGAHLWMSVGAAGLLYFNPIDISGNNHVLSSASGLLVTTAFQHVAASYDKTSGQAKIYLNGAVVAQAHLGIFTPRTSSNVYLGYRPSGDYSGIRYLGLMDEVDLFNRVLTDAEVQAIYNAGGTGKCPPPFVSAFTNGSFELPAQSPGFGQELPPGSTAITGWKVGAIVGMGWQNGSSSGVNPVAGAQHVQFNVGDAVPGSYIFQTFNTTVSQAYTVSFYVGRAGGGGGTMSLLAKATSSNNAVLGSLNAIAPGSAGYGPIQTFTFTATTTTSTLTFQDTSSATAAVDLLLDNVSVVPTPPPPPPVGPFTNGSFELPVLVSGSSVDLPAGSTNILGWKVGNAGLVSWRNGPAFGVAPIDGSQEIGFNGSDTPPGGAISQTFSTAIGQTYEVRFNVGRQASGSGSMSLFATVTSSADAMLGSLNASAPSSPGFGPSQAFTFTATTAASTLAFTDTSSATVAVDVLLDNVTVTPVSQCAAVPSGLVSWWQGESNASDSSGINSGTLIGNATFTAGKVGQAFSFDGNGDAVFLGNPAALHLQDFTIEAWIKRSSTTQASQDAGGGLLVAYGGGGYAFGFLDDGRTFLTQVGISDVTSTYHITDTNFHHVAVTKTGSAVVFYVDGVAYPAASFGSVFSFGSQVAIGARGDNFANSFLGLIDELDVFNRALTGAEILAIYNIGAAGKCGIAPSIITQPSSQARTVGGNAVFTVVATGASPLTYQWRFNTTNIVGAVNPSLTLANLQATDAGAYSVVVSNAINSVTSSNAILTVNPAPPCAATLSGLVGWWRAQENALDAGGANNGTLIGNTAYAAGQVGQAFAFDGNSDAVQVGNPASLQLQNFTIEAWIKRASATQISFDPSGGEIFGYGAGGYIFGVVDDGHLILSAVQASQVSSSVQITDTSFHHVAVTKTGSSVVFYVDGVAYPAPSYDPGFSFTSQAAIGARGDNSGNSFLGLIDEVAVFNRALAAPEIQTIYNAGSSGKCSTAPFITSQPTNQVATVGANVTFTVIADGTRPLSYQWRVNGTNIVAATNTSLTLTSVQLDDAGGYDVVIGNEVNSVTSSNATLTVNLPICVAAPSNLISWWQGEGNALDSKGTNHGTVIGNVTYAAGRVGQAFSFDGNGDAVRVGNPTSLQFQNLTIEAWIKRGSTTQASLNAGGGLIFAYGGGGYALGFLDDGHLFLTRIGVSQTTSTIQVTDTNFHHVAVTRTNSTVMFYVDGVAFPAANLASVFTFTSQAAIGARGDNSGNSFLGVIDEVTLYNRALSAAEMQSIYNSGGLGKCGLPPVILTSPQSQTVRAGSNVTFNVVATGTSPLNYQWRLNTTNIVGATNSALALTNVQSGASGTYTVVVGNSINSVTSAPANLKVIYVLVFGNGQPLTNSQHSFVDSVSIQLQTVLTNGTLFYTLDGSTPSFASAQYLGAFPVTQSSFLRVLTYSADFLQSYEADAIALIIIPSYTITATTPGGGTVSVNPTNSSHASNTVVTVTAMPSNGWTFLAWQGDVSGTNPVVNVTMNGNKSVQAVFGTSLGTTVAGSGAITVIPSVPLYPFDTVVQLYATPQTGNYFALWGNAASGSSNPLNFTITSANPTISSLFGALSPGQFALTVIPNGSGQISVSPQTNRYSSGQNVTVTAVPDAGQHFIDWSGDATGTNNPLLVSMTQSKVITANFTQPDLLEAGPQRLNSEGFHLTLTGELGSQYRVDGSTNLLDWTELFQVITFDPVPLVDSSATNTSFKFYRAVKQP